MPIDKYKVDNLYHECDFSWNSKLQEIVKFSSSNYFLLVKFISFEIHLGMGQNQNWDRPPLLYIIVFFRNGASSLSSLLVLLYYKFPTKLRVCLENCALFFCIENICDKQTREAKANFVKPTFLQQRSFSFGSHKALFRKWN